VFALLQTADTTQTLECLLKKAILKRKHLFAPWILIEGDFGLCSIGDTVEAGALKSNNYWEREIRRWKP
jgi:hypothetical protein